MPIIAKCRFCGLDPRWGELTSRKVYNLYCRTDFCCNGPFRQSHDEAITAWNALHGVTADYPDSDNQDSGPEVSDSATRFKLLEID